MLKNSDVYAIFGSHGYIDLWGGNSKSPYLTIQGNWELGALNDGFKKRFGSCHYYDMQFSPNGRLIITYSVYDVIRFWDARTGNLLGEEELNFEISDIAISPDGRIIAVTGEDGLIRLFGVPGFL